MSVDLAALAKRAGGYFDGVNANIPGPGHSKADRSLSLTIGRNGQLIAYSFSGDDRPAIRAHLLSLGVDISAVHASAETLCASEREGRTEARATRRLAIDLWREAKPVSGTPAAIYLEGRGIVAPYPPALRFHPRCPDGPFKRPALIAARTVLDTADQVGSIQRTFLRKDGGGKAHTEDAKKTLGPCRGGGVVLGEIVDELVIAEGVETALSAAAIFAMPAVATLGTSFTRALTIPERVRRVVIAADNDAPGLSAAQALAARLRKQGRDVRIETPAAAFKDFNDLTNAAHSLRGGERSHER